LLLLADVHRVLGQWEQAQPLYREVLSKEPNKPSILVNLGAYHFLQGDYTSAIESFQDAVDADPNNAAALYNLSQAFNEGFLYSESRAVLDRAVDIDEARVTAWLRRAGPDRVLTFSGGLGRGGEIRRALLEERISAGREQGEAITSSRRVWTPVLLLLLAAAAVGLHFLRRRHGYSDLPEWTAESESLSERLLRILVPGLDSAQKGRGLRAFLAWLVPVGLLLLPLGGRRLFRLPWGFDPGSTLLWWIAGVGLLLLVVVRVLLELNPEEVR
jgi:tetratricopeptide (TPR) repeat protein